MPRYVSLDSFLPWWNLLPRRDWSEVFGRTAPLDLEIGVGNGEFLGARARRHPERNFIGLDLRWSCLIRALRLLAHEQIQNARLLQVDARMAVERLFPSRSLESVSVLFPCPWRKERAVKHRLLDREFLRGLNNRLVDGGSVLLATDYEPFYEWVLGQVPGTGFLLDAARVPPEWGTRYEHKWRSKGQKEFFRLRLIKSEHRSFHLEGAVELITHQVEQFDPRRFVPPSADGEILIRSKEFLFDSERRVGMLRIVIVEGSLNQHVWIRIAKSRAVWKIYPASGTGCVPTAGVQLALDQVRDAVIQSSRSARV